MLGEALTSIGKAGKFAFVAIRKSVTAPSEALLLCRMAWWVAVLSATAKWRPLPEALELVSGRESRQVESRDDELPDRLAKSIDLLLSADILFFKPICWKRATVLRRYLSLNGFPTMIQFGVRNELGGTVTGHAWLEADGKPILEKAPPEYIVTYSFPSKDRYEPQTILLSSE